MGLWEETGHSSMDERVTEASRLVDEIAPFSASFREHEQRFLESVKDQIENKTFCSAKQLFWLRDLYEKYCI